MGLSYFSEMSRFPSRKIRFRATVHVETDLEAPPEAVWATVCRYSTLVYVMRGLVGLQGEFPERVRTGDRVPVKLFFFHVIPAWTHVITIVSVDDRSREIFTNEHGGIVRAWNHRVRVLAAPGQRTRYVDHVEIEAGLWTPIVWAWGQLQYRYRQARWRALAKKIRA